MAVCDLVSVYRRRREDIDIKYYNCVLIETIMAWNGSWDHRTSKNGKDKKVMIQKMSFQTSSACVQTGRTFRLVLS